MTWRLWTGIAGLISGLFLLLTKLKVLAIVGILFLEDLLMVKIGDALGFGIISVTITISTALLIWYIQDGKKRRRWFK